MKFLKLKRSVHKEPITTASRAGNHEPDEFDSDDCLVLCRILRASLDTCAVHERHAIRRMIDLLEGE